MPITIPGSRFLFEDLFRVRPKDLPRGSDPEILTKFVERKDVKTTAFFLVRKLPLRNNEPPIAVHYYYAYSPRGGGEMGMCSDFITDTPLYLEAITDLNVHALTTGLTLDDGTVVFPRVVSLTIERGLTKAEVPAEIRDRTDLDTMPVKTRATLDSILVGSIAEGMHDDTRFQTVLDGGSVEHLDPVTPNVTERGVRVRYRLR